MVKRRHGLSESSFSSEHSGVEEVVHGENCRCWSCRRAASAERKSRKNLAEGEISES